MHFFWGLDLVPTAAPPVEKNVVLQLKRHESFSSHSTWILALLIKSSLVMRTFFQVLQQEFHGGFFHRRRQSSKPIGARVVVVRVAHPRLHVSDLTPQPPVSPQSAHPAKCRSIFSKVHPRQGHLGFQLKSLSNRREKSGEERKVGG
ncbi:photosystem I light harvesting complex gene 5 [Striga asiatica]|uniref:Photosystem I light harvesting complex gene 5 n=1 Tax=Striga asiatica TaxID=4170 RepID=A0A5A7PUW4_STRAF|nr:photosystem I light harvesting complex gene 5 [Striga asiatica]